MDIKDKIYEIIEEYDGSGDVDECVDKIEEFLKENNITDYKIEDDTDVYDSCGLDIFYISVAWNDENGLHLCGSRLTSC